MLVRQASEQIRVQIPLYVRLDGFATKFQFEIGAIAVIRSMASPSIRILLREQTFAKVKQRLGQMGVDRQVIAFSPFVIFFGVDPNQRSLAFLYESDLHSNVTLTDDFRETMAKCMSGIFDSCCRLSDAIGHLLLPNFSTQ
jgi:hypothetical protein